MQVPLGSTEHEVFLSSDLDNKSRVYVVCGFEPLIQEEESLVIEHGARNSAESLCVNGPIASKYGAYRHIER